MPPASGGLAAVVSHLQDLPVEPARGGTGITKKVHFQNGSPGAFEVGLTTAYHPPSAACGVHDHRGARELFIVVGGRGYIWIEDVPHAVKPGDSVLVPAGTKHNVRAAPASECAAQFVVHCLLLRDPDHLDDEAPWTGTEAA